MKKIIPFLLSILILNAMAQKGVVIPTTPVVPPKSPSVNKPKVPATTPKPSAGTEIWKVDAATTPCISGQCMLVKKAGQKEFEIFEDVIQGFEFTEGNTYTLQVRQTLKQPPIQANESIYKYELVKVISSSDAKYNNTPVPTPVSSVIAGVIVQLEIDYETIACESGSEKQCFLVKEKGRKEYEIFNGCIYGFTYEAGNRYVLQARKNGDDYDFVKVIKKEFVAYNPTKISCVNQRNQYSGSTPVSTTNIKNVPSTSIPTTSPLDKKWYLRKMKESEGSSFTTDDNVLWIEISTFNDKLKGFGSCNNFEAVVRTDLTTSFQISKLTSGYVNCGYKKIEDLFYSVLQQADRFEIRNGNLILSKQWKYLMELTSDPNKKEETISSTNYQPGNNTNTSNTTPISTPSTDKLNQPNSLTVSKPTQDKIVKEEPATPSVAINTDLKKDNQPVINSNFSKTEPKITTTISESSEISNSSETSNKEVDDLQKQLDELKKQVEAKKQKDAAEEQKKHEQEKLQQQQLEAEKLKQQMAEIEKQKQETAKKQKQKEIDELKKQIAEKEKEVNSPQTTPVISKNVVTIKEEPVQPEKKLSKSELKAIEQEKAKEEKEKKIEELNKSLKSAPTISPITTNSSTNPSSKEDEIITVGIFPFKGQYKSYVLEIQNQTIQAFSQKSRFVVVDRTNTALIKSEKELQKSEDFIDGLVVDQGKSLGAKYVVTGDLQNVGVNSSQFKKTDYVSKTYYYETKYMAYISFALSLLETETGKVKSTQNFTIKSTDVGWAGLFSASAGYYETESAAIGVVLKNATGYIKAWINNVFPVLMKIVRVEEFDKKGNPSIILIKGGADTDLKKGSDLYVISPEIIEIDGKEYSRPLDIGQIKVINVDGEFSECKIKSGAEKIQDLITNNKPITLSIKSYK